MNLLDLENDEPAPQSTSKKPPHEADDLLDMIDIESEEGDNVIHKEGFDMAGSGAAAMQNASPDSNPENPFEEEEQQQQQLEAGYDDDDSVYIKDNVVMRRIQIEGENEEYLMDPEGNIYDMNGNFIGTANTQELEDMEEPAETPSN